MSVAASGSNSAVINFAAMRDPYNYDDQTAVLDSGNHPIVAHAKPPESAPFALQALAQRPRVVKRRESFFEEAQNALSHRWIELL